MPEPAVGLGLRGLSSFSPVAQGMLGGASPFMAAWGGPLGIGLGALSALLSDRTYFNREKDAQRNALAGMGREGAFGAIGAPLDEAERTGAGLQTDWGQWIDSFKDVYRDPALVAQLQAKQDRNARGAERFFGFGQAMGDVGGAVTGAHHNLPGGYAYQPAEERSESGGVPRFDIIETGAPKEELSPADLQRFTNFFGGEGNIYNAGHERTPTGYRRRVNPYAAEGGGGNA